MSKKKVLIVGSGPSAALAILAAADAGVDYTVVSATDPTTRPPGAFFLHWLPPSLRALPVEVEIQALGTAARYELKQWGAGYGSSFPTQPRIENWYPAEYLQQVWTSTEVIIQKMGLEDLLMASRAYDFVFHTFPVVNNQAVKIPVHVMQVNTAIRPSILYNGMKDEPWCRQTKAWGEMHTEYPWNYKSEFLANGWTWVQDLLPWAVPVTTRLAPNVIPIGRMAQQQPKYLAHMAYNEVMSCLTI
jgi:hypothetical protein